MIFKKVFGDHNDLAPLRTSIKVITKIDAKEITILNSKILGENISARQNTIQIVKNILDNNTDINIIATATGLSIK